jgi:predicted TIM-barrel fold metal-dependent hydrolase
MIVDSHCHAWRYWPYQPPVPDPESRGTIDQLLWEMDRNGVDRAAVVCARIDHNPDDNDYVAGCVRRHPDRLYQLADVDCSWSDTYHTPGAAERLERAVEQYRLPGFTHYVRADDDGGWFLSEDGLAFLEKAAELRQVASFAIPARLQPVLRQVARRFPDLPFLCHHMAGARVADPSLIEEIVLSAELPNIHVKLSGFHYASRVAWEYPYPDCAPIVRALYDAFGPERLHWGSDYPVVRRAMTYQQSLEAVRTHCLFIPDAAMARVLGDSLHDLLAHAGPGE